MNPLRKLTLALVSVLVLLGAVGATAASASEFEAESYPAHLKGGQVEGEPLILETEAGTIECATVTATGEQTANSETVALALTTSECIGLGFLGVGIHFNGCTFQPRAGANLAADKFTGTLDIICPANKSIVFTAGTCEFDIPEQKGVAGLGFDLETEFLNWAIKFTFGAGLKIKVTKDGFGCPFLGTGDKSASLKGSLTISAWDVVGLIIKWIIKK